MKHAQHPLRRKEAIRDHPEEEWCNDRGDRADGVRRARNIHHFHGVEEACHRNVIAAPDEELEKHHGGEPGSYHRLGLHEKGLSQRTSVKRRINCPSEQGHLVRTWNSGAFAPVPTCDREDASAAIDFDHRDSAMRQQVTTEARICRLVSLLNRDGGLLCVVSQWCRCPHNYDNLRSLHSLYIDYNPHSPYFEIVDCLWRRQRDIL